MVASDDLRNSLFYLLCSIKDEFHAAPATVIAKGMCVHSIVEKQIFSLD